MLNSKRQLVENCCIGCITGIYSGIVLFAIVVSLFFQPSFSGITALKGYGIAMAFGGLIGLISAYIIYKQKAK
ncbi:MAG: hypothetical protein COB38_03675 [Gammaproteobacteria bacterium]|nr:MAG: hypothetical protein COB38_03675 [Gammaproteobacteria bacterium]